MRDQHPQRSTMKTVRTMVVLAAVLFGAVRISSAADQDGVAVAIVYDTSGSMEEPVRNSSGQMSPKYVIANRALLSIASQIQAFATNTADGGPHRVEAGLYIFSGEGARPVVPFGPFDAAAITAWATNFSRPNGGTPLGNALTTASTAVLNSPLSRKHVLIITDGINTLGPAPAAVMPRLQRQAERQQTSVSVHFVAFDVDAGVFSGVKRLGADVVSASDETQLDTQLNFILQNQILLEKPANPKSK